MRRFVLFIQVFASAGLLAQELQPKERWYLGAGIGITAIAGNAWNQAQSATDKTDDGAGFLITGGHRLNRNLAIEISYIDNGHPKFVTVDRPPCPEPDFCHIVARPEVTAATASLLFIYPLEPFEVYAKGGAAFWDSSSTITLTSDTEESPITRRIHRTGTNFIFGVGAGFTWGERSRVRFTVQLFGVDRVLLAVDRPSSINQVTIDYHWRF